MIFDIVDVASYVIEVLIAISFFKIVAVRKEISLIWRVLIGIVLVSIRAMILHGTDNQMLLCVASFGAILVISFLYKIGNVKRLVLSVMLVILLILFEVIIGLVLAAFMGISVEAISQNIFNYMQGALFSKLSLFVVIRGFVHFGTSYETKGSNSFFVGLMIHPIATFLVIFVMSKYMYVAYDQKIIFFSTVAVLVLITSNILLFYLFEHYQRINYEKDREQLLKQEMEYKAEYYKELSNKQKITNKTMHDLKNQLFALKESLKKDTDEGIKKINSICDDILLSNPIAYTGNETIDALVSVKAERMKNEDIKFKHSIFMASTSNIDIYDMCIILGNLLDNAIEASRCVQDKNRNIELNIRQHEKHISLSVCNTVDRKVQIEDNKIRTTKKNKELHGFGIMSIKEIAEKYNGNCTFKQEGDKFQAVVMLENA